MATELAIQPANLKQEGFAPPYAPSWFDHFKQWVEGLPVPYWLFYLVLGLALVLCAAIIQWTDGSLASGNFSLLHLQLAAPVALFFGLTHYLDRTASAALANIRPSFDLTDIEFAEWKYKLTTLPSRSTWLATGAGLTFVTLAYLLTPNNFQMIQAVKLSTSRQAIIFWSLMILAGWGAYAVLYYHAIHQLRLISRLYAQHIQIDLFKLNPLYSLSALTLRTAIGLVVPPYLVVLTAQPILPEVATIPEIILVLVVASVIAVLTFVLPLLSLHRRLQEEKARAQDENAYQLKLTLAELHRRLNTGETQNMADLNHTLSSLVVEENTLAKIPTWPWHPETVRWLATAILLPLAIWLVNFVLQRAPFKW